MECKILKSDNKVHNNVFEKYIEYIFVTLHQVIFFKVSFLKIAF